MLSWSREFCCLTEGTVSDTGVNLSSILISKSIKSPERKRNTSIWLSHRRLDNKLKEFDTAELMKNFSKSSQGLLLPKSTDLKMSRRHYYYWWLEELQNKLLIISRSEAKLMLPWLETQVLLSLRFLSTFLIFLQEVFTQQEREALVLVWLPPSLKTQQLMRFPLRPEP